MAANADADAAAIAPAPAAAPPSVRFADSFWDDDDRGVSILTDKMAIATQTCNEIQSLYEIRAQIEEDYGDRLLKLSQMMIGDAEGGTFSESISHVPTAIEITARAHVDLAHQLRQQLQAPLLGFIKDFEEKRDAQAEQIKKAKELRSKHHASMLKAKDRYTAEYTKMLGMKKYIFERHREMAPTEVHQIEEEIEDQKKQVFAAEKDYKHAVDVLNSATRNWVSDWQSNCDLFQFMEEDRMNFVRNSLWAFANMMSSVYVVDDQCCERIRSSLEMTDVQKDLGDFVESNKTGSEIPEPIPYDDLSNLAGGGVGAPARGPKPLPLAATIPSSPSESSSASSPPLETRRLPALPTPASAESAMQVARTHCYPIRMQESKLTDRFL
ncbi:hypothetical protein BX666DRAFT_1998943 [Dichotomocladium elegans]|nr:hypothetical protein BX666DRAFT_1998943 [Dichotomocladium elegans]